MNEGPRSGTSRLVLLEKAPGVKSFQAIGRIKRIIDKKTGHAGTLDKFAEGLLIVLTGSLTRLNPIFSGLDKKYIGTVCFGEETDTLDPEGVVVRRAPIPTLDSIAAVLDRFRGSIEQTPPVYSAIHVGGKRAYKEARAGKEVEMPKRIVEVYSLEILAWQSPYLTIAVHCSKGTYIRSLARDIGYATGSAAYLTRLVRTAIGQFSLSESVRSEDLNHESGLSAWELAQRLSEVLVVPVSDEEAITIRTGVLPQTSIDVPHDSISGERFGFLFDPYQNLVAVTRIQDDRHSSFVFVCPLGSKEGSTN